jgi:tellurite resistance protein TehA-like permease
MGTGALALALNQFPLPIPGAYDVAGGLWLFDIVLFVLLTALYAARWIFFFDSARQIFGHPVASMFLGAIPMGLATIINGLLIFGLHLWGNPAICIAHALVDRGATTAPAQKERGLLLAPRPDPEANRRSNYFTFRPRDAAT